MFRARPEPRLTSAFPASPAVVAGWPESALFEQRCPAIVHGHGGLPIVREEKVAVAPTAKGLPPVWWPGTPLRCRSESSGRSPAPRCSVDGPRGHQQLEKPRISPWVGIRSSTSSPAHHQPRELLQDPLTQGLTEAVAERGITRVPGVNYIGGRVSNRRQTTRGCGKERRRAVDRR